jgi:hypothetical protein
MFQIARLSKLHPVISTGRVERSTVVQTGVRDDEKPLTNEMCQQIIHHNTQEMDKDDENDADRGSSLMPSAAFLVVPTALHFVARMHESYMDEIFHVP